MVSSLLENPGYDKKNTRIRCVIRSERHREDLEDFEDQVEVVIGDIKKEKANKPVFHGVKAAYFAVPLTQGMHAMHAASAKDKFCRHTLRQTSRHSAIN